ncbi:unnamed protein product [Rotaria sp. Silwood2]|nr:unnamed protein product [Rotaria sp. Silwood2]CAF4198708.1 unnamed protein product [Rotaria sp. Silwood2]
MIIAIPFYSQFGVSVGFLVTLFLQLILIIIDQTLYLCRNVHDKLYFRLFQIIAVHIWFFFVLPEVIRTKFRDNVAAQFWYIFKCIYFGYSSIQIRLGYSKCIVGNFLMKCFNYVNQGLYQIYLCILFLRGLQTMIDWMFIDATLDLMSCIKLEDIYSNVYLIKCARWAKEKYSTESGVPWSKATKYCIDDSLLILSILLILFPLCILFMFISLFYQPNPLIEPIYEMTATDIDLVEYIDADYNNLCTSIYSSDIEARIGIMNFLNI